MAIQIDLKQMLKMTLRVQVLTDSETLFNEIIRNASTTEKRLMIDMKAAREAYNNSIIDDITWSQGNSNWWML